MSTTRLFNFGAGPSMLPGEVVGEIRETMMDFGGMSILEISHRSKPFGKIIDEARSLVAELMELPAGYDVLFLQGGATQQFAMVPMNLMDRTADYVCTGAWSQKAFAEAKVFGQPREIFSSEAEGFSRVPRPEELSVDAQASYLHITSNNTIFGTQYASFPETGEVPLVADMSSDILSRRIDAKRFGLIYAGAQKNLGPAGVTLVVVREDLLARDYRPAPKIWRYVTHAKAGSLSNTPPVFAIWATLLNLRWMKRQGGVAAIEARNQRKAALLYEVIDAGDFYRGNAEANSRSMMNVTFTLPNDELAATFLAEAEGAGLVGLKGHRSVGGIRASIYNAMPLEGVEALTAFMREFSQRN